MQAIPDGPGRDRSYDRPISPLGPAEIPLLVERVAGSGASDGKRMKDGGEVLMPERLEELLVLGDEERAPTFSRDG
jgi:hypothetical protein